MLTIIYALPFFLFSVAAASIAFAVPKWRRYVVQSFIAPLTFGFFSILGMLLITLCSNYFQLQILNQPLAGVRGVIIGIVIYIVPGLIGTWLVLRVVGFISHKRS